MIHTPPKILIDESRSPKNSIAQRTVTKGSKVDTSDVSVGPIRPSPKKNAQNATTVEKRAIAIVASIPSVVFGGWKPLLQARMTIKEKEAESMIMAEHILAVSFSMIRELQMI